MSLIMDHPAWPSCILQPSGHSQTSEFARALTISVLPSFTLLPQLLSLYCFCRFPSSTVHIPYVWAVSTACFLCYCPIFSAFANQMSSARCLITSFPSVGSMPGVCLSPHFSLVVLPQLLSLQGCELNGSNYLSLILSPEPCHGAWHREVLKKVVQGVPSCPCQIRAGYRRYREKTHPNNKGLKI